jgi:hypothetical protein
MLDDPIAITLIVTGVFEQLGVPYLIGGSLASTLHGMVRTTQDSGIIADMQTEHIQPFLAALQGKFYVDEEMIAESIKHKSSFNIIHRGSMFKVDVFVPHPRPFFQSQLARVQRLTFSQDVEKSANFASPEDTILAKLEWFRMGGDVSERQWRDVLGILKVQGNTEQGIYPRRNEAERGQLPMTLSPAPPLARRAFTH